MDGLYPETQRLDIREHNEYDLEPLYRLLSDKKVIRYIDLPHNIIQDTQKYLDIHIDRAKRIPRRSWKMAICLKDKTYTGMMDISVGTEYIIEGRADLSSYLLPEYWDNGYTSEACRALISFGFDKLKIHKITAGCLKTDTASEKVMIACGMRKEVEFREHAFDENVWISRIEYRLLGDEAR